jgi:hypothetical protein
MARCERCGMRNTNWHNGSDPESYPKGIVAVAFFASIRRIKRRRLAGFDGLKALYMQKSAIPAEVPTHQQAEEQKRQYQPRNNRKSDFRLICQNRGICRLQRHVRSSQWLMLQWRQDYLQ